MSSSLPAPLEEIFSQPDVEALFAQLLPTFCQVLQVDRCFLHLRHPETRLYRNLCWRQNPELPDTATNGWQLEQQWEQEDPMFAAALRGDESIFVPDVETADPTVLNREFERKYLGHRALVHAHLYQDGLLWGILQPSVFGHPTVWSDGDRDLILEVVRRMTPIVMRYVKTHRVKTEI